MLFPAFSEQEETLKATLNKTGTLLAVVAPYTFDVHSLCIFFVLLGVHRR
jgi:hypothetical protein